MLSVESPDRPSASVVWVPGGRGRFCGCCSQRRSRYHKYFMPAATTAFADHPSVLPNLEGRFVQYVTKMDEYSLGTHNKFRHARTVSIILGCMVMLATAVKDSTYLEPLNMASDVVGIVTVLMTAAFMALSLAMNQMQLQEKALLYSLSTTLLKSMGNYLIEHTGLYAGFPTRMAALPVFWANFESLTQAIVSEENAILQGKGQVDGMLMRLMTPVLDSMPHGEESAQEGGGVHPNGNAAFGGLLRGDGEELRRWHRSPNPGVQQGGGTARQDLFSAQPPSLPPSLPPPLGRPKGASAPVGPPPRWVPPRHEMLDGPGGVEGGVQPRLSSISSNTSVASRRSGFNTVGRGPERKPTSLASMARIVMSTARSAPPPPSRRNRARRGISSPHTARVANARTPFHQGVGLSSNGNRHGPLDRDTRNGHGVSQDHHGAQKVAEHLRGPSSRPVPSPHTTSSDASASSAHSLHTVLAVGGGSEGTPSTRSDREDDGSGPSSPQHTP